MGWPCAHQRLHQASAHGYVDFFVGWATVGFWIYCDCALGLSLMVSDRFTWAVEMTCMPSFFRSFLSRSPTLSTLSPLAIILSRLTSADFEPHLLKLGLAKSQTSLVWIAPPLSGLIVQPIVGVLSDSSQSRWGRRRPYMLLFSILVAFFLVVLAWTAEIVGVFLSDEVMVGCVSPILFWRV